MPVTVQPIPALSDNYIWLLRDTATGAVALVDPAETKAAEAAVEAAGRLDMILITHHHADHIDGVEPLRERYKVPVVGAKKDAHRLPRLDQEVVEGDTVKLGDSIAHVIETPGHTIGHIAYHFPDGGVLLCGDTLFSVGCGRLLEGTAADMFGSLKKLGALPPETLVACGHEYTESNIRFALTVEPENAALQARALEVKQLRGAGRPTVPSMLGQEHETNPFLRAGSVERLAEVRTAKDNF